MVVSCAYIILQEMPELVDMMLGKLAQYYSNSVEPANQPSDLPAADPAKFGGVWEPWL